MQSATSRLVASETTTAHREKEAQLLSWDIADWRHRSATANERIVSLDMEHQKVKSQVEQLQISQRDLLESNCVLNEHISKQDEESTRENNEGTISRENWIVFNLSSSSKSTRVYECHSVHFDFWFWFHGCVAYFILRST